MESGSKYQRPLDYQIRKLGDPCGIYYGFQTEYLVFRHLTIGQMHAFRLRRWGWGWVLTLLKITLTLNAATAAAEC